MTPHLQMLDAWQDAGWTRWYFINRRDEAQRTGDAESIARWQWRVDRMVDRLAAH